MGRHRGVPAALVPGYVVAGVVGPRHDRLAAQHRPGAADPAHFDTIIRVPRGNADDSSRDPAVFDRVAAFLCGYGVRPLAEAPARPVLAMTGRERRFA